MGSGCPELVCLSPNGDTVAFIAAAVVECVPWKESSCLPSHHAQCRVLVVDRVDEVEYCFLIPSAEIVLPIGYLCLSAHPLSEMQIRVQVALHRKTVLSETNVSFVLPVLGSDEIPAPWIRLPLSVAL